MTYRAGIVGCGRIGCGFDDDPKRRSVSTHAGAYTRTPGVELAALCDTDAEKLERYGARFVVRGRYKDCREMLAREQLDILSVCTPDETHRTIVEQAVEAGVKAIFCEKPIAENLGAAEAMVRRCAEAGVLLMVDHQRRFDRLYQDLAAYVREGRLGRVQQVTCYYTAGVANTGSHLFDLLRFFFGEAKWVSGIFSQNRSPNPRDPNIEGWLQFDHGVLAAVQACDVQHYTIFEMNLLGTLGRLRILSHGFEVQFESVRESPRFSGYRELCPAPPPVVPGEPREFMLQGVAHLLQCLEQGAQPLCSGQDGLRALELIAALRESAEADGRRIHLPLVESPLTAAAK